MHVKYLLKRQHILNGSVKVTTEYALIGNVYTQVSNYRASQVKCLRGRPKTGTLAPVIYYDSAFKGRETRQGREGNKLTKNVVSAGHLFQSDPWGKFEAQIAPQSQSHIVASEPVIVLCQSVINRLLKERVRGIAP